jgi:hypothetical protein
LSKLICSNKRIKISEQGVLNFVVQFQAGNWRTPT